MGRHSTAKEVEQNHLDALGDDLGSLYHGLWNEVAQLYSKWDEYVELFGTKPSRIKLLNDAAPLFFRTVQDSLWESMLLHISRLTDPPKSCGKANLSIQRILPLVSNELKGTISEQINNAISKTDFCRDWRNRKIAHKDLRLALKRQAEPLKPASRAKIKDALGSIATVLNTVSEHYMDATIEFNVIKGSCGAESLLYVLDDGLRANAELQKRIETRTYTPEDLTHRNL